MKKRLDIILLERGFFLTREKARSAIMSGKVQVNSECEYKPGAMLSEDCFIKVKEDKNIYVSRGGTKLAKAIEEFNIDLSNLVCADIGASTGGFTDCMLKSGAKKIYAIDVGYGQLAWELRNDDRVINMERTNARYLNPDDIGEEVDFASIDVSFISLTKIIPAISSILKTGGELVCLVKPQFEAGREKVGNKGVVRDRNVHVDVLNIICEFLITSGYIIKRIGFSPIRGPEGNIEYLVYSVKNSVYSEKQDLNRISEDIQRITKLAHASI